MSYEPTSLLKFPVIGLLTCGIVWLALDHSPREAKWASLAAAYDRGEIGHLPQLQNETLKRVTTWLAAYAHVKGPISVNERPTPGHLNIITTTQKAIATTGCASGNAIYDADLDVIFIDEHIVWPREIPLIGEVGFRAMHTSKYLGFPTIYMEFVLLHELGHRSLHSTNGGFFDAKTGGRETEAEADRFAIDSLRAAYTDDLKNGGSNVGRGAADSLQMDRDKVSPAEHVWVDLLGSVSSMSTALLFSGSNYSSFYEDSAHPTFLDRAFAIYSLALQSPDASRTLKAHAAFHLESLRRTKRISELPVTEYTLPNAIQRVTFDKSNLIVLTDHGNLYAAPLDNTSHNGGVKRLTIDKLIARGSFPDVDEYSWLSVLWSSTHFGPIVLQANPDRGNKEMVAVGPDSNGGFTVIPALKKISDPSSFGEDLAVAPQPSRSSILGIKTRTGGDYQIIRDGQVTDLGSWSSVRDEVRAALRKPTAEIDINTISDNIAYLSIVDDSDGRERLRGIAKFDLEHNRLDAIVSLVFEYENGGDAPGVIGDRIVVVPNGSEPRFILVTRNMSHFLVFELFANRPMRQIAIHAFILDGPIGEDATSNLIAAFDPKLSYAQWIPPSSVVMRFNGDSIFIVNLNSGHVQMLFNPGARVQVAIGASGQVAFYAHNGYRIYVETAMEADK